MMLTVLYDSSPRISNLENTTVLAELVTATLAMRPFAEALVLLPILPTTVTAPRAPKMTLLACAAGRKEDSLIPNLSPGLLQ